ncbi:hypothetical protein WJX84_003364 [Apatococcus fuscideae]|uniref:Uncharacterized protein n=1 Tax=Apatococcus fuscideae TaxID=2026836 RepID=A0AAW1TE81_9CHLO
MIRQRRAEDTPAGQGSRDRLQAVRLGLTPGSSDNTEDDDTEDGKQSVQRQPASRRRPSAAPASSDRFGRLSDVMEDGMPTDIELPELEGQLEDINPAMLQAEEECLDQDIVHVFSPAQPQGLTQYQLLEDSAHLTQIDIKSSINSTTRQLLK